MNEISNVAKEGLLRSQIVEEALSWVGTKFRYGCEEKGKGIDCARFIMAVYKKVGIVPERFQPTHLPRDWFRFPDKFDKHEFRKDLFKYGIAIPVENREPGDVISFYYNNMECHLGIIIDDEFMVHAMPYQKVKKAKIKSYGQICSIYRARVFYAE